MNTKTKIDLTYCEDCSSFSFVRPSYCLNDLPGDNLKTYKPVTTLRIAKCKLLNARNLVLTYGDMQDDC